MHRPSEGWLPGRGGKEKGRNLNIGQSPEAEVKEMSSGQNRARGSKAGTGSRYTHIQGPALQEDSYMQGNQNFEPNQGAKQCAHT